MVDHKVTIGGYTVVCSGVLVIPVGTPDISIEFGSLRFNFEFESDDQGPGLYIKGQGKTLSVSVKNYTFENSVGGRGKANEFMKVGLYKGMNLYLSFLISTRRNKSRVFTYTFASLPESESLTEGDTDDQ
jgi:hypothetical protein